PNGTREAGSKGDHAVPSLCRIHILEHLLTGEHPAKRLAHAAVGGSLHLHVGRHPGHAAALVDHLLAALQVAQYNLERISFDLVLHRIVPPHFTSFIVTRYPAWFKFISLYFTKTDLPTQKAASSSNPAFLKEWSIRDLNPWPPHCQCGALPTALMPHAGFILSHLFSKEKYFLI